MKDLLAGSRTDRLPSDNPVASHPNQPLCPICVLPRSTAFDFSSFSNVLETAIHAGDILAKLLSKLHLHAFCSHFCELTLNQLFLRSVC
jgi:hypothetical protein